ncbi:fluoride efflux transporter FluC [Brevibacillus gelatini]
MAVAVGGAVGSLLRYGLAQVANLPGWPVGTWLANVIGSFAIGVLFVIGKERGGFSPELYLLFTTGMLGGIHDVFHFLAGSGFLLGRGAMAARFRLRPAQYWGRSFLLRGGNLACQANAITTG